MPAAEDDLLRAPFGLLLITMIRLFIMIVCQVNDMLEQLVTVSNVRRQNHLCSRRLKLLSSVRELC